MPLGSPAGPLSVQAEAALTKRPLLNTRRVADRNLGPMLPATRYLLREFHQPLNQKLASVLDNKAFLWDNTWGLPRRRAEMSSGQCVNVCDIYFQKNVILTWVKYNK